MGPAENVVNLQKFSDRRRTKDLQINACTKKWTLNHDPLKVLVYLATKTPIGKNRRNPRPVIVPWAIISLSIDVKGGLEDSSDGVVLESRDLVKSSVVVPES